MDNLTIERLGHQGDGIAPGPIYVAGALPSEVVSGRVEGGRLQDMRIVTPSPDRVSPPCAHARSCGGCQLQHARDSFVAEWKRGIVQAALEAQGVEGEVLPAVVSPPRSRRRATFSARRTKKGALAGFHQRASDMVIAVPNCQLVVPELTRALPCVKALAVLAGSRKGALSVLITQSETGLDVDVRGGKPLEGALVTALADLARSHDLARLSWEGEVALTRRAPVQRFGDVAVTPPPGAFLQATQHGEAALRDRVLDIVQGAERVVDLFAGCGTFALPLARHAAVHAVEGDAAMTQALDHGWRHGRDLKQVTTEHRDLFRNPLLASELSAFQAAVIDPPRAGAEAQMAELARSGIPVIAHVSCNPQTFARDAKTLMQVGYRLGPVHVVDQFRWSTHVEVVAGFTRT